MAIPTVPLYSPHGERVIVNERDALEYISRGYSTASTKGGTYTREVPADKKRGGDKQQAKGSDS